MKLCWVVFQFPAQCSLFHNLFNVIEVRLLYMKWHLYIILLLLPTLVHAQLTVTPPSTTHDLTVLDTHTHSLTITNAFNHAVFNITALGHPNTFTFPLIEELLANTTFTYNYTSTIPYVISEGFTTTFSYLTRTFGNAPLTTHTLLLTNTGITGIPSNTIRAYDTISVTNTDTATHTLLDSNNLTYTINAGQTTSITFITQGTHHIVDTFSLTTKTLNVTNRTIATYSHDFNTDIPITMSYTSTYANTSLEAHLLTNNLALHYNATETGVLRLHASDRDVFGITLHAPWLTFEEQDIDLLEGQTQFISFTLTPDNITHPDHTNKSYFLPLTITSDNTNALTLTFNATILYADTIHAVCNQDDIPFPGYVGDGFYSCIDEHCVKIEPPQPIIRYVNTTLTETQACSLNGTITDLEDIANNLKEIAGSQDRNENKLTSWQTGQGTTLHEIDIRTQNNTRTLTGISNTVLTLKNNDDTAQARSTGKTARNWTIAIIAGIIILLGGILYARHLRDEEYDD